MIDAQVYADANRRFNAFPGIFEGYLSEGTLKDAIERGILEVNLYNMRQWARQTQHDGRSSLWGRRHGVES